MDVPVVGCGELALVAQVRLPAKRGSALEPVRLELGGHVGAPILALVVRQSSERASEGYVSAPSGSVSWVGDRAKSSIQASSAQPMTCSYSYSFCIASSTAALTCSSGVPRASAFSARSWSAWF